jgi:hypothetical protein
VLDTLLAIYSGTCGSLTEIACNDDADLGAGEFRSVVTATGLTAGTTYLVQIAGWSASDTGSITVDLTCAVSLPPGDECSDAIPLACDSDFTFDNTGYSLDAMDPLFSCGYSGPSAGAGSAWFTFVATDTSARLHTNASTGSGDTLLAVYNGTCGAFTEIACSEDEGTGFLSELCVSPLMVGTTYYVQVASFSNFSLGDITLTIQCPCPAPPANDTCATAEDLGLCRPPSRSTTSSRPTIRPRLAVMTSSRVRSRTCGTRSPARVTP